MERFAPVYSQDCVDSTNTRLKAMAREGAPHGTVLTAREQSGGRGRLGRRFESPPDGLYLSMLLLPDCAPERCATLTPLAAVAVCRAIAACTGLRPQIKWPNDVLSGGRKLCGILVELQMSGERPQVIVGIGVNVNTAPEAFSAPLRETAGSLRSETGKAVEIDALRDALIRELDALYDAWRGDEQACLAEYRAACLTVGRPVLVLRNGERREAEALAVNADFSLRVEYPDGSREDIRSGEVSIRER